MNGIGYDSICDLINAITSSSNCTPRKLVAKSVGTVRVASVDCSACVVPNSLYRLSLKCLPLASASFSAPSPLPFLFEPVGEMGGVVSICTSLAVFKATSPLILSFSVRALKCPLATTVAWCTSTFSTSSSSTCLSKVISGAYCGATTCSVGKYCCV